MGGDQSPSAVLQLPTPPDLQRGSFVKSVCVIRLKAVEGHEVERAPGAEVLHAGHKSREITSQKKLDS